MVVCVILHLAHVHHFFMRSTENRCRTGATGLRKQLTLALADNQRGSLCSVKRHSAPDTYRTFLAALNAASGLTLPIPARSPLEQMTREELEGRIRGMG